MGQLTAPGTALVGPAGNTTFVGTPTDVMNKYLGQAKSIKPVLDGVNPNAPSQGLGTPSYREAASAGATPGGANALSPGLTKAGKLATLLTAGLQGALAGRAKSEETVAATGGRRSGGAGMGFEAGYTLPWKRAEEQQQLAQGQAQTDVLKSQAATVNTPQGPMPGWLAKSLYPAIIRSDTQRDIASDKIESQEGIQKANRESRESIAADKLNATKEQFQVPLDESTASIIGMPDLAGKPLSAASWKTVNAALTAKGYKLQDLGDEGEWLIDKAGNRIKRVGNSPGVARAKAFAESRPVVAATDPENPDFLGYTSAAQAMKGNLQAPASGPSAAARKADVGEVPKNIGDLKVNFTTMIQHAQLLRTAAKALNNNDVQALNGLQNAWLNAFGDKRPITAQTIADAYGGEVSNVINKGHITDRGNEKIDHTINPNKQNFEQIDSVLSAYENLAQSKMNMLNKQITAAKTQGKNKPAGAIELERGPDGKLRPKS